MIHAAQLTSLDAYTGVALRARVEHQARGLQRAVCITPPTDGAAWSLLGTLLGELPRQVRFVQDALPFARARNVFLPSQAVSSLERLDLIAEALPTMLRKDGVAHWESRLFAAAFSVLGENALLHGDPSGGGVAAIAFDPSENALQLVVLDRGQDVALDHGALGRLQDMRAQSEGRPNEGGLAGLVGMMGLQAQRGADLCLRLRAGSGSISWRGGRWHDSGDLQHVAAFCASLISYRN